MADKINGWQQYTHDLFTEFALNEGGLPEPMVVRWPGKVPALYSCPCAARADYISQRRRSMTEVDRL